MSLTKKPFLLPQNPDADYCGIPMRFAAKFRCSLLQNPDAAYREILMRGSRIWIRISTMKLTTRIRIAIYMTRVCTVG